MPDAPQGTALVEAPEVAAREEIPAPKDAARRWEPIAPQERIALIDTLRGLALLGIIAANMRGFAGPIQAYTHTDLLWHTRLDLWVQAFIDVAVQGKFISIFSFLFGLGFALQFSRAQGFGADFVPVYRRRLLGLMLIGALHQLLFWWGDVLVTYALAGFLLIPFRKRKNKTILIWALALMLLPFAAGFGYLTYRHFRPPTAAKAEANRKEAQKEQQRRETAMRDSMHIYQTGSYAAIFNDRLEELWRQNRSQPFVVLMTLPLFMFGMLAFRLGIFQHPAMFRAALFKVLIAGAVAGLPMNLGAAYIIRITGGHVEGIMPGALQLFGYFLFMFGAPVLSLSYISAIVLLFLDPGWHARLLPAAAVGRTALSNYLFQTILCTTIFYGYGGGLFAKVNLAWLLILSLFVFAVEVPLSGWWVARHRFGPAEWAWRSMTYVRYSWR